MPDQIIEGYTAFVKGLKKLAPDVDKRFRKELRTLAAEVASQAKSNAGWSTRIPGAIGTSVTNRGAGVKVSRKKAPHGSLFERGSKGNGGEIRHPVFGNYDVWVTQPIRPFIEPAVAAHRAEFFARAEVAFHQAATEAGLL